MTVSDNKSRQIEKTLRVVAFPQGDDRVPSVRVAGKWLMRFGFELGDKVILIATEGRILITKKEASGNGCSLV